ncbi:PfkB family carbohydrate kinase [Pleomorphovibrio marinus]|uniref:PfkB family carbohydrate kinase n=1 Tax=Pleomorphovibrio marinus TaxID=2164132 RepID=UPI000E0A58A6|nr:PfkB family carbohydrate kinase [Pleomorphovibrio marinus]
MKELIAETIEKLQEAAEVVPKAFVGFDGYVDKIQLPVKSLDGEERVFFPDIFDFSKHLAKHAGKSGQVELKTRITKAGGNAPIMSDALWALSVDTTCMGTLGKPKLHPVFEELNKRCKLVSLGPEAVSNAFEFGDGKIIFSELDVFDELDWQYIKKQKPLLSEISKALDNMDLLAFVDWVNLPHATDIWRGIATELLPKAKDKKRYFFFDLCDPSKKSSASVREMLEVLSEYQAYGTVVLGLNENETILIYAALKGEEPHSGQSLITTSKILFSEISVDLLLVHPNSSSILVRKDKTVEVQGKLVEKPKVLTGAGDNFNAGFMTSWIRGLGAEHSLLAGMAASGHYITTGHSASIPDVVTYLKNW